MSASNLPTILLEVSQIATIMRDDLGLLQERTQSEIVKFHAGDIALEDLCFWHKSLVRAFFAQVEALCNTMREFTAQLAQETGIEISAKKMSELSEVKRRIPITKNMALAFRFFPRLFGEEYILDAGGEDYRAFKNLCEARDSFTHPKKYGDLCPFSIFATMQPAMEWFLLNWKALLVRCLSGLGAVPSSSAKSGRRFTFKDERIKDFEEARLRYDAGGCIEGSKEELQEIIAHLLRDTKQAFDLFEEFKNTDGVPRDCAARNLLRTIFSEIEGSTFAVATYLSRFALGYEAPTNELLIGSHQEVRERIINVFEGFSREFRGGVVIHRSGPPVGKLCNLSRSAQSTHSSQALDRASYK